MFELKTSDALITIPVDKKEEASRVTIKTDNNHEWDHFFKVAYGHSSVLSRDMCSPADLLVALKAKNIEIVSYTELPYTQSQSDLIDYVY
jgi:hypothetical protein